MKVLRWFLLVLLAAGCASTPDTPQKPEEAVSIVFGFFDMTAAPSDLEWVSLKRGEGGGYRLSPRDGFFFELGVWPGTYEVDRFGGSSGFPPLTRRPVEYDFRANGRNPTAVRIERPGVYFLGAYEFIAPSGEMRRLAVPSEKQLLQRVIRELETDRALRGRTRALQMARARIAEL
jgi:hypothetical protein